MAKMNSALKWTLIIGGLGVTGVVGYFVYKKIKEMQQENAQNEEAKNNPSVKHKVIHIIEKQRQVEMKLKHYLSKTQQRVMLLENG